MLLNIIIIAVLSFTFVVVISPTASLVERQATNPCNTDFYDYICVATEDAKPAMNPIRFLDAELGQIDSCCNKVRTHTHTTFTPYC